MRNQEPQNNRLHKVKIHDNSCKKNHQVSAIGARRGHFHLTFNVVAEAESTELTSPYCIIDEKAIRTKCGMFRGLRGCTWLLDVGKSEEYCLYYWGKKAVRRDKFWGGSRYLSRYAGAVAISDAKSGEKTCSVRERGLSLYHQKYNNNKKITIMTTKKNLVKQVRTASSALATRLTTALPSSSSTTNNPLTLT